MEIKRNNTKFSPFKLVIDVENIDEFVFLWTLFQSNEQELFRQALKISNSEEMFEKNLTESVMENIDSMNIFMKLDEEFDKYFLNNEMYDDDDDDDVIFNDEEDDIEDKIFGIDVSIDEDDDSEDVYIEDEYDENKWIDGDMDISISDNLLNSESELKKEPLCNDKNWNGDCIGCPYNEEEENTNIESNSQYLKYENVFRKHGDLHTGKLLGSKSLYRKNHPNNTIYFNANIFTEKEGKIWWGDLDYTLNKDNLIKIATELGETLYVLQEHDGRWGNEKRPFKLIKQLAVQIINPLF